MKRLITYIVHVTSMCVVIYEAEDPENAAADADADEATALQAFKNGCADQWPHDKLEFQESNRSMMLNSNRGSDADSAHPSH